MPAQSLLLLVATNPASFRVSHRVPSEVPVLGPWSGVLQDSGERLELLQPGSPNTNGIVPYWVVDGVRFNDKAPWPIEPDGLGPSLDRVPPGAYGNDPIHWRASAIPGAAPAPTRRRPPPR